LLRFFKTIIMAETINKLFSEFPPVTTHQWEEKIAADLKGKDYEKALVWHTIEGIAVKPYYRAENLEGLDFLNNTPGQFPFVRGNKSTNEWLIRQDIVVTDRITGNPASWLAASIENVEKRPEMGSKRWLDIWSAGQSVAQVEEIKPAGEVISGMVEEYLSVYKYLGGTIQQSTGK